jgi:hypothetical protein
MAKMKLERETVESWAELLTALDIDLSPIAREHGYSKDALLISHMINKLTNGISELIEVIQDAS